MSAPRPRPVYSCLMLTSKLNEAVKLAKLNGCVANWDHDAGTVDVTDDGTEVLSAIQKGHNQPWIVLFFNSERITWSKP